MEQPRTLDEDDAFRYLEAGPGVVVALAHPRARNDCNGVIVDLGGSLAVIDTHARPDSARAVATFGERHLRAPIRHVVNTHHHWDHWLGNEAYADRDVTIYAHRRAAARMRDEGDALVNDLREVVATEIAHGDPVDRPELERFAAVVDRLRVLPAGIDVEEPVEIAGERRTIRLLHLGPAHTDGDLVVEIPDQRAVATGDCVIGWTPYFGDADPVGWVALAERLLSSDAELLLLGHGAPAGKDWLVTFHAYLRDVLAETRAAHAEHLAAEAIVDRVRTRLEPAYRVAFDAPAGPDRSWMDRMVPNVERILELLDRRVLAPAG